MRFGVCSKYGRAFLLGTSALAMTSAPAVSADITINANTMANQTLNAGDTLTVNNGIFLNPSTAGAGNPIVTVLGSNTTLTNNGQIILGGKVGGSDAVAVVGLGITNVIIVNNGTLSNAGHGINVVGTVEATITNDGAGGASIGGSVNGILVNVADITGGIDNNGTIRGGVRGIEINGAGNIGGPGLVNQMGATISGGTLGLGVRGNSNISGGIDNHGTIKGTGLIGLAVSSSSNISGRVMNQMGGKISGGTIGLSVGAGSNISGGIDNHGLIRGTNMANSFGVQVANGGSDISGGLVNQATGTISGASAGIFINGAANVTGLIDNKGTIKGFIGLSIDPISRLSGGINNSGTIEGTGAMAINDLSTHGTNVVNSGTLRGVGGVAVSLLGADDSLTLDTGSVLVGGADGGAGTDTLILKGVGTEDDDFFGFESLEVNGTDWALSGDVTLLVAPPPIPFAGPVAPLGGPGAGMAMLSAGTLRVNGTLTAPGGVSLAGGATLGGTGEVVGMVTNNGTIAPGNSVGTLKVTGDVAFAAGSSLEIEVDGAGNIDLLDVMGSVTVDPAAVLGITFAAGAPDLQGVPFVAATGTVDANFQTVNVAGATASSSLVAGNSLVVTSSAGGGGGAGGGGVTVVGPASVNTAAYGALESGFSFQRAVASEQRARRLAPDSRLWARGIGDIVERDGKANNPASQQDITGVAFGGDTPLLAGGLRLGLAGGYLTADADATDGSGHKAEVDSLQGLAYGTYDLGAAGPLGAGTEIFFGFQGGYQDQDIERAVNVGGTRMVGRGDTSGYLLGGYLGVSHTVPIDDNWTVRPGSQVSYLHQSQDGYRDSQGLSVDALDLDSLRLGPQVEMLGHYVDAQGVVFQPHGRVGWTEQVALGDRQARLSVAGAGADLDLEDGDEGTLTVGFGLDVIFTPGIRATVGFDGAYGAASNRSSVFAGVSLDLP